jgi:uncharacterized protein (TIGR02444 family)
VNLWAWALAAWARPGVERACLDLQDLADQSVVLLLWCAWRVAEGRPASADLTRRAADVARPVEVRILRLLRAARRSLAEDPPGLDDGARQGARDQIRAAEFGLERALLEALETLPRVSAGPADVDLAAAFQTLMEFWTGSAPGDDARMLADALAQALSGTPA